MIEDKRRGGPGRRASEVSHAQILDSITHLQSSVDRLGSRFAQYERDWSPLLPELKEAAAISRSIKLISKIVVSAGIVATALVALIALIKIF